MTIAFCAETALTLLFQDRTRAGAVRGEYGELGRFDARCLEEWADAHNLPPDEPIHVAATSSSKGRRPRVTPEKCYYLEFHTVLSESSGRRSLWSMERWLPALSFAFSK